MFNLTINEDEFKRLIREAVKEEVAAQVKAMMENNKNVFIDEDDKWVYGYKGIMQEFQWKRNKVAEFLKNPLYADAICQENRKIAVNVRKARELMQAKMKSKHSKMAVKMATK